MLRQKTIYLVLMGSVLAKNKKSLVLAFAIWGVIFTWLLPRLFYETDQGIYAGVRSIWADWAAHMTYFQHMLNHPVSDWFNHHPLFYLERFNYPFAMHLLSLFFHKMGASLTYSFTLPSLLVAYALLFTMVLFFDLHKKSAAQILICISLFFLSGGLGFLEYIKNISEGSQIAFGFPIIEYTNIPSKKIELMNILTFQLLPQRAFLLGLCLGLGILSLLASWRSRQFDKVKRVHKILLGISFGSLVIVHPHSVFALGVVFIVLAFFDFKFWRRWIDFALTAFLSSIALYFIFIRNIHEGSFFQISIGWLANDGFLSWINFWWLNGGIFLLLAFYGTFKFRLWANPFVVSGWIIFTLCNLFQFSPWLWDNTKLFTWAWLFFCIPASETIFFFIRNKSKFLKIGGGFLCFLCVFSGGLEVSRMFFKKRMIYSMWSSYDIKIAQDVRKQTSNSDLFVIEPNDFQNFVLRLSGRPVLMGYTATLWSYGFDYQSVEEDIKKIFAGGKDAQALIAKYGLTHAVLRKNSENFEFNFDFFSKHFTRILSDERYDIYKMKP